MDSQSVKSGRPKLSLKWKKETEKNSLPSSSLSGKETQELPTTVENQLKNVTDKEQTTRYGDEVLAGCSDREGLGVYFFCHICQKDLTRYNVTRREQHINRCCDEMVKEELKVTTNSEAAAFVCVICHKSFTTQSVRLTHMKSCARQKGISTSKLLELVRSKDTDACTSASETSQETQVSNKEPKKLKQQQLLPTLNKQLETAIKEEDGDFTMPPPQEPPKKRRKRKRQNLEQEHLQSVEDEQLQLALAMSASMASSAGVVMIPEDLQETGRKRKSRKKAVKGAAVVPPLVTVTSEQAQAIIAQRAEQILKADERGGTIDDDDTIPCTPAFGTSDLAQKMLAAPALPPSCPTTKPEEEADDHCLFLSDTEDDRMSVHDENIIDIDGCTSSAPNGVEDKRSLLAEDDDIQTVSHSDSTCDHEELVPDTKSNDNVLSTSFADVFQHLDYPTLWQLSASEGTTETASQFYVPSLASFVPPSNKNDVLCRICNTEPCLILTSQQVSTSKPAEDSAIEKSPLKTRNSKAQSENSTYESKSTIERHKDSCQREASGREQLISDLKSLIGSSFLSDVEITTKSERVIPAHAVILAARCSSIRRIIEQSTTRPIPLDCSDFEDKVVLSFLHYVYTGSTQQPTPSQHQPPQPDLSLLAQRWGMRELFVYDSEDSTQYYSASGDPRLEIPTENSSKFKPAQQSSDETILQENTDTQTTVPQQIVLSDNNNATEQPADSPTEQAASNSPTLPPLKGNSRGNTDSETVMSSAGVLSDDFTAPPGVNTVEHTALSNSSNSDSDEVCVISDVDEGADSTGLIQTTTTELIPNTEEPMAIPIQYIPEDNFVEFPHSPAMVDCNVSQLNTTDTRTIVVEGGSSSVELSEGCSETASACTQPEPPCEVVLSSTSSSRMSSRAASHVSVSSTESAVIIVGNMEASPSPSQPTENVDVSEEHNATATAAVFVTEKLPFCFDEQEADEDIVATCIKPKEVEDIIEITVHECGIQDEDTEGCNNQEGVNNSTNEDDRHTCTCVSDVFDLKQTTDNASLLSCTLPLETAEVFDHSVDLFATPQVHLSGRVKTTGAERGLITHTFTTPSETSAQNEKSTCKSPHRDGEFKTPGETKSVQFLTPTEMTYSSSDGKSIHVPLVTPVCDRTVLESDDNITPMPDYTTMQTPLLKKRCSRFGVKPLAKKKMIAKLEEIYDYTHPMVGEDGKIISAEEKVKGTINHSSKPKTKTKKKPPAKSKTKVILNEFLDQIEGETDDQEEGSSDLRTNVINCIIADVQLYQDILLYKPLELSLIHTRLKAAGLNVAKDKLADVLDSLCITYTLPRHSSTRKKS